MSKWFIALNIQNEIKRIFLLLLITTLTFQLLLIVPLASATHPGQNGDIIAGTENATISSFNSTNLNRTTIYSSPDQNDAIEKVSLDGSGNKITYILHKNQSGDSEIRIYDRQQNVDRLVRNFPSLDENSEPLTRPYEVSTSRNGQRIAVTAAGQSFDGVFIINTSNGAITATHSKALVAPGGWNQDDTQVFGQDESSQDKSLAWFDVDSDNKTIAIPSSAFSNARFVEGSSLSPDRQSVIYTQGVLNPDNSFYLQIREMKIDGTSDRLIIDGSASPIVFPVTQTSSPQPGVGIYSPDGLRLSYYYIVYDAEGGTSYTLASRAIDGDPSTEIVASTSIGVESIFDWAVSPVTVDNTAPVVSITQSPSPLSNNPVQSATFTVDDPTATTTCQVDSSPFVACASSYTTDTLPDGQHTITIRATDPSGNVGTATTTPFTIDSTAPDTTISAGPSGTVYANSQQFVFNSSEANTTFECRLQSTAAWSACASPFNTGALQPGQYNFQVRAKDAAGNIDQSPATRAFTYQRCAVGPVALPLLGTVCL